MTRIWGTGILRSLQIAWKQARRGVITVQYPHEKLVLPQRARWAVAPKYYHDGESKCTGCLACERACPDHVIELLLSNTADGTKHIDHWRYEIGACMMCGLCVEACPFDAIEMSHNYELARTDPALLVIDLLTDVAAAQPKRRLEATLAATCVEPETVTGADAVTSAGDRASASTDSSAVPGTERGDDV